MYFGQEPCLAGHTLVSDLTPHEFLLRPVNLHWGPDDDAHDVFREALLEQTAVMAMAPEDLSLVAVATSPYLKISDVVLNHPLSKLEALERVHDLTGATRRRVFSTPHSGFSVDLYLVLTRSREPAVLKPHRFGIWLTRSQFRIGTTLAPAVLPPTPLTQEVRERYRLGSRTIRFLHFGDHDVAEAFTEQERPVFYIDERLLAQMNARSRSNESKALQLQLAQDFVAAVVRRASTHSSISGLTYDDLRTSLIGSVIRIAAGPGATEQDRNKLVGQLTDHPEYVIARAEHFIDVGSGYTRMFKENGE